MNLWKCYIIQRYKIKKRKILIGRGHLLRKERKISIIFEECIKANKNLFHHINF